ncbi:MAG: CBS domain-containing protein [Rhodospirillales bacterium]|nr:CBS domain-containing protein [Rhodospirillales bacterium]
MKTKKISELFDLDLMKREISENATIADAIDVMKGCNYSCLLVKNKDGIGIGIISEHDLVTAFSDEGDNAKTSYVSDFMQVDITCAGENDTLDNVMKLMAENDLRVIPIVSDEGYVISFLSVMELLMVKISAPGA